MTAGKQMILANPTMKKNCKKLVKILILALAFNALAILSVSAQKTGLKSSANNDGRGQEKGDEIKAGIQAKFCERLSELSSKIGQRFSEMKNKIQTQNQERLSRWEDQQSERDAKLEDMRSKRDANFEEHFKKLEERARTETQKNATAEFEKAVRAAIETRRSAIDNAIESFRNSVKNLHASRKSILDDKITAFMEAQESAFAKAKTDCENGSDPATVRETLRTALAAAKTKFTSEKQNAEEIKTQMEALIQIRKNAIEKASADFQAAMTQAKNKLKAAFPDEESQN